MSNLDNLDQDMTLDDMLSDEDDMPSDDLSSSVLTANSKLETLGNVLQSSDYLKHCCDIKGVLGREDFEQYLAYFNASLQKEIAKLHGLS